ncbi:MAG TPA: hypothetical protein VHK88_07530 [Aquihabitans sp.]|jgi:hypothetical protein|nr:hypothetical protein [Aquihabitans sp.]
MPTTSAPAPEVDEPLALPSRVGRTLAVIAALAMILFWIWIFAGGPRKANADRLDDRAYVERTEQRCQRLLTDLDELPAAGEATSAAERADVLDRANVLVAAMVDDIQADAPTTGDDGESLRGWFADWRAYVADREAYAERLRADPDARLLVTENPELKDSVDRTIKIFADVNDMPDCATPGDVG